MKHALCALTLAGAALVTGPAVAATTIPAGGATTVTLSSDALDALLPLNPVALGSATLTPPDIAFPITGGLALTPDVSVIRHEGSGLGLSLGDDALNLEDFVVNTGTGVLTGSVSGTVDGAAFDLGPGVPVFDIGTGLALDLTVEAAEALAFVFDDPALAGLDGFTIGTAEVAPVPVPAALPLMGAALGLLGVNARRARA